MSGTVKRLESGVAAARAAWRAMRSTSRRGLALVVGATATFAVVFYLGLAAVASFASQYGHDTEANAGEWRALVPAFAQATSCGGCHAPQQARLASATHAEIGCESCHGPLRAHALAGSGPEAAALEVAPPTDAVCLTCHEAALGRPARFRQVEPDDHYVATCLQCHDPHTGISNRPPIVEHPLERLPECVTCHGPDGFKARNQRHPTVSDEDRFCLSCHLGDDRPDEARVP
jgi:hypothetical protein